MLPKIVVLMLVIWKIRVKYKMAIFLKTALNSESSTLPKMSDILGTVLSQKLRPLQQLKNESCFAPCCSRL